METAEKTLAFRIVLISVFRFQLIKFKSVNCLSTWNATFSCPESFILRENEINWTVTMKLILQPEWNWLILAWT